MRTPRPRCPRRGWARWGPAEPTADLAAHSAVAVFQVAFGRWVSADEPPDLATCIARDAAALRALT
ncbi:hypothetical protein [Amycolatopsis aidingensis]|uniref:hypothetical protein n=1 Tax=Amycolatopsis aidingensis TaxID=2842453 RepID=UPI001C0E2910|nr:hypothetical protein [Amycolatopsis aidingensis]